MLPKMCIICGLIYFSFQIIKYIFPCVKTFLNSFFHKKKCEF